MKKVFLFSCSLLCFLFLTISCNKEDDSSDFDLLELGPSSVEVTQDGFTFRFWLADEDGIEKNVFAKGELINFCYSLKNNQEVGQWVDITSPCSNDWGVVYKNGKVVASPCFFYEEIMTVKYFEPSSAIDRSANWLRSNCPMPVLKRGKYYTSIQASFSLYDGAPPEPDSEIEFNEYDFPLFPLFRGLLNFPELQLNFGIQ